MSDKTSDKLIPCPCCGGEAALKKYYESYDGRYDKHAQIICCDCEVKMELTWDELCKAKEEFGYTGGYYSQNKSFWDGMHQKLINKWNTRKPMERILERLEEIYDFYDGKKKEAYYDGDWEEFDRYTNINRGIFEAIATVKKEGGIE